MKIKTRIEFEGLFTELWSNEIQNFKILTAKVFQNREAGNLVTNTSQ